MSEPQMPVERCERCHQAKPIVGYGAQARWLCQPCFRLERFEERARERRARMAIDKEQRSPRSA